MINFMQSNQDIVKMSKDNNFDIIDNEVWENLTQKLVNKEKIELLYTYVYNISIKYNIDKKNIIKDYLNYIIRNKPTIVTSKFLQFVENLLHSQESNNQVFIYYSLSRLSSFI